MLRTGSRADVVEEHLDEAVYLWGLRRSQLASATTYLRDLARIEARLHAQLRGLVVGRSVADPMLRLMLSSPRSVEEVAVATTVLAHELPRDLFEDASSAARCGTLEAAVVEVLAPITELDDRPAVRAARGDGPSSRVLAQLRDGAPDVRSAAFVTCRHAAGEAFVEHLEAGLDDDHDTVRSSALAACAVHRSRRWRAAALRALGDGSSAARDTALLLLSFDARPESVQRVVDALDDPAHARSALRALGASGRSVAIRAIVERGQDGDFRAEAARALRRITGEEDAPSRSDVGRSVRLWRGRPMEDVPWLERFHAEPLSQHAVLGLELAIRSRGRLLWAPQRFRASDRATHLAERAQAGAL